MKTPPPEILAAAQLITDWAANNNIRKFAIAGIQQRVHEFKLETTRAFASPSRYDDWCTDYHCAGDCGLRGHGHQHGETS